MPAADQKGPATGGEPATPATPPAFRSADEIRRALEAAGTAPATPAPRRTLGETPARRTVSPMGRETVSDTAVGAPPGSKRRLEQVLSPGSLAAAHKASTAMKLAPVPANLRTNVAEAGELLELARDVKELAYHRGEHERVILAMFDNLKEVEANVQKLDRMVRTTGEVLGDQASVVEKINGTVETSHRQVVAANVQQGESFAKEIAAMKAVIEDHSKTVRETIEWHKKELRAAERIA